MITTEPIIIGNELTMGTLVYEGTYSTTLHNITLDKPFAGEEGLYAVVASFVNADRLIFYPTTFFAFSKSATGSMITLSIGNTMNQFQVAKNGSTMSRTGYPYGSTTSTEPSNGTNFKIYKIGTFKD